MQYRRPMTHDSTDSRNCGERVGNVWGDRDMETAVDEADERIIVPSPAEPPSDELPQVASPSSYVGPDGKFRRGNPGRPKSAAAGLAAGEAGGAETNGDDGPDIDLPELMRVLRQRIHRLAKRATPAQLAALSQLLSQLTRLGPPADTQTTIQVISSVPRPQDDAPPTAPEANPAKSSGHGATPAPSVATDSTPPPWAAPCQTPGAEQANRLPSFCPNCGTPREAYKFVCQKCHLALSVEAFQTQALAHGGGAVAGAINVDDGGAWRQVGDGQQISQALGHGQNGQDDNLAPPALDTWRTFGDGHAGSLFG